MQKDYRDGLEIVKFDLIEETAGSWLRAIIRRLEEDSYSKGSTKAAGPKPRNTEASLPEAPSEVCKAGETLQTRRLDPSTFV
jgi:hypothetical protein